jgi:hypothetical protein
VAKRFAKKYSILTILTYFRPGYRDEEKACASLERLNIKSPHIY